MELQWARDQHFADFVQRLREGVVGTGVRLVDTCVLVTVRSGYLKTCEVAYCHSLEDPSGISETPRLDECAPDERRPVFCASSNGVTIDAYVALAKNVSKPQRVPLRPWRAGTWLAHTRFRVRCRNDAELFRPQPLGDTERENLKLPNGTVTFAEFDGDITDPEANNHDMCTFWVDRELLETIDAQRRSPAGEFLQRWLFAEFVSAVVLEFSIVEGGESPTSDDVGDSLIGKVAGLLAGRRASEEHRSELLRICQEKPHMAIAIAQDVLGLRASVGKSMRASQG